MSADLRHAENNSLIEPSTLPSTPALRREQIKLQVALITPPPFHVKGPATPETAAERARLLIEQAEALGEPAEDPLLLFSVLYSFWVANFVLFNGDALRELAAQFLAFVGRQTATGPRMVGHRIMGASLLHAGDIAEGRAHYDQALALYDPAEPRPLATRFGQEIRVAILGHRAMALWALGYAEAALADTERAREISHAATLMYALYNTSLTHILRGNYAAAKAEADELAALADEKGALLWKAWGNDEPRLRICPDQDHLRNYCCAVNGRNTVDAVVLIKSSKSLCRTRSTR